MVLNNRKMTVSFLWLALPLQVHPPASLPSSHISTLHYRSVFCKRCWSWCFLAWVPQGEYLFCLHVINIHPLSFSKWGAVLLVFHYINSLSVRMIHFWMFKSSLQKCKLCFWDCLYIWNANSIDDKTVSGPCIGMLDCQAQFLWNSPAKFFWIKIIIT